MLTAAQIDALRDATGQLLDPVTDFLIEDIARRVLEAGQLTGTAAYQVWRAQNLGMSQKKLKKSLQEKLKVSERELERLLTQSAETGYNFDLSRLPTTQGIPFTANSSIQQIVAAVVKQANKDLTNIVRTMGFVGSDGKARELTKAYKKACDDAFMRTVTGAQDATSAIRDALKGLSEKGIVSIDYSSRKHFTVEAAIRRSIMGGMGLMQEKISEQNFIDMGCDGWEISAHAASAPDHAPFQGRQYTDKQYRALNDSLVRRIGQLNCGHAAFPIIIGVHSPQYTEEELEEFRQQNEKGVTVDGRQYTTYEATQRQRQLERAIRGQKRKILIDKTVDDPDKLQNDQIKLVRLRDEYARFSKKAGLPTQHARAEAAGFTWKDGKAAERTEKANKKISLANSEKDDTITVGERNMTISSIDSPIEQRHTGKGKPGAILHYDVSLTNRQAELLESLPEYDSRVVIKKSDVSMTDLAALTAKTGDEFALFTREGERLVIRGSVSKVNIDVQEAIKLAKDGYTWSGHTHPGVDLNCLVASPGDMEILKCFKQERSSIYNSLGEYLEFWKE